MAQLVRIAVRDKPTTIRFRLTHKKMMDELLAKRGGGYYSKIVDEALDLYFRSETEAERVADIEERIVATLSRVMVKQRGLSNELHVLMAFLDCFVRSYLTHTPAVPAEALDVQASSAAERYRKLMAQIPSVLDNGDALAAVMTEFNREQGLV